MSTVIHKKADPFLKWLKEAEEEDSEEEDDAVDVVYSNKPVPAEPEPVEEDDGLDIDAI